MIWISLALFVSGIAIGPLSAVVLTRGHWQVARPRLALWGWAVTGACGIVLTLSAVLLAAVTSLSYTEGDAHGEGLALTFVAWIGMAGLGVVGSLAVLTATRPEPDGHVGGLPRGIPVRVAQRRIASRRRGVLQVIEVDDPRFVAMAAPGPPPVLLVSRHARLALSSAHLHSVLAHEEAHVRARHVWWRLLGAWHVSCLPKRSGLRRELDGRLKLLTELAADDIAATSVGTAQLCSALERLHRVAGGREFRVRAERLRMLHDARPADQPAGSGASDEVPDLVSGPAST